MSTNKSHKSDRESVERQQETRKGEMVQALSSPAVQWCLRLSVRAPICALLVTLICKALFIQGSARASHTRAKATTSARGLGQLWNSAKSKCCLMFYFLSTNIKERGKNKRELESWGGGRRESIAFAEAAVSFKKPVIDMFSPENILSCTSAYDSKKINLEKESSPQSSCDRFSDGVLINHTDNEVANCCLMAKLKRQLPQWVSMNMSKDCPTGSPRRFSETFL